MKPTHVSQLCLSCQHLVTKSFKAKIHGSYTTAFCNISHNNIYNVQYSIQ